MNSTMKTAIYFSIYRPTGNYRNIRFSVKRGSRLISFKTVARWSARPNF